jgi:hypothetical protein
MLTSCIGVLAISSIGEQVFVRFFHAEHHIGLENASPLIDTFFVDYIQLRAMQLSPTKIRECLLKERQDNGLRLENIPSASQIWYLWNKVTCANTASK